jgi:hypothetical protein
MTLAPREILGYQIHLVEPTRRVIEHQEPSGRIFQSATTPLTRRKFLGEAVKVAAVSAVVLTGISALFPDSVEAAGTGPTPSSTPIPRREPVSTATTSAPDLAKSTKKTPEVTRTPTPEAMTAEEAMVEFGMKLDSTYEGTGTWNDAETAAIFVSTIVNANGKHVSPKVIVVAKGLEVGLNLSNYGTQMSTDEKPLDVLRLRVSEVVGNENGTTRVVNPEATATNSQTGELEIEVKYTQVAKKVPSGASGNLQAFFEENTLRYGGKGMLTPSQGVGTPSLLAAITRALKTFGSSFSPSDAFKRVTGLSVTPP